jgi:SepF-like predicted cell division protein (DUF552 family)
VVGEETDASISAWSGKTRPAWERVLKRVEAGEIDVVVAWHIDRMTRSILELERLIEKRSLLSEDDSSKLKKLKSQLEAQEILLSKTTKVKANQDRIKSVIDRLRSEIAELNFKRESKLMMSAEAKAEEEKTFYVCTQCVFDGNDNLFWKSYEHAMLDRNFELKNKVFSKFLKFYHGFPTPVIREIARSNAWRIRYVHSIKTSEALFGIPVSGYTSDQLNLIYWSNYYQNIYEMMPEDRPSDLVIDDDESLDAYMKSFYEERNRDSAARKSKSKRRGKLSAFDSEEVIVTGSHELYQDIQYDKPREAQKIRDRVDIKKRSKRG